MVSASVILQYSLVAFVIMLEILIVWAIFTKQIDLKYLISEKTGEASLSRFQLLMFTFAIVGLYITFGFASGNGTFPVVDNSTLGLLGISGATYGGSKLIQLNSSDTQKNEPPNPSGRFVR